LEKSVGNYVVSQGITVFQLYGRYGSMFSFPARSHPEPMTSTENCATTETLPKGAAKGWEWLSFSPSIEPQFTPDGHEAHELWSRRDAIPHTTIRSFSDGLLTYTDPAHTDLPSLHPQYQNGYSTGDLVNPYLSLPDYWKVFGRADHRSTHHPTLVP